MGRFTGWLFFALVLGYGLLAFLLGQHIFQTVLKIDPIDYLPMPGPVIQAIGLVIALVLVVAVSFMLIRLLDLDKM